MVCRKNNFCDQHPLMTIQTDLSGVRDVGHDRMPTNRRQSECALKLPGLRPSSWMLAALAGGGAVDGGLTAMVKVLGGEGFVCVNTWGFKNFDSNQIVSTDIKQSAVAASESALPRAHEMLELTLRVADAPAIRVGDRDRKVPGIRDFSNDSGAVNRSAVAWQGQWPGRLPPTGAALRVDRRTRPRVLHPLAKPSGSRVRQPTRWRHPGRCVANRGRVHGSRRRSLRQQDDVCAVGGASNGEMRTSLPLVIYSVE